MKLFKTTILTLALLATATTYAQEAEATSEETTEEPTFSVSGSIDTYYRSNREAPPTSFADLPGFALGMANIILSYEGEKHGFVADLVYGPRGEAAVFGSEGNGSSSIINQLYAYYNISDKFTLTLGNFNTFLGYEVIAPAANFNYSTSYMFSTGPFSHTGLKADIAISDDISFMAAIMNTTDETEYAETDETYFGLQLGLYGQYINLLSGDNYTQFDYTGGFNFSEKFYLGINATTTSLEGDAGFSGVALYPQLALSDSFSLGFRGELFSTSDGTAADDLDLNAFTITGSFSSGNLIIKPEFRIDTASSEIFGDTAALEDNISSFVLAAIYSF
ncbi:MAG: hypothetical protein CMP52_07080 [Flavobacteriales bacterium]|nr:hypothetical protein [Candidatus Arcticimaribacter sp.]|tara:strand:+ start:7029 stop:8030 length:1002 start_codon:yes stop_codon:yes gene_type:complete